MFEVAATTILYSNNQATSPTLLANFSHARRDFLIPFKEGLTSQIYRLRVEDTNDGNDEGNEEVQQQYCIKRVLEEDEVPPHSIRREMMCYRFINEERSKWESDDIPIITLLAAIRDESDPFSVMVDLFMPLYPCTLEDLMNEPLMQINVDEGQQLRQHSNIEEQRPALLLAERVHATSLHTFIKSTTHALFSALFFLHKHGIAHRDIKPSNILIDSETLSIVLIDFGTCYLTSYREGDDGLGGMTSEVGTGSYRAPECLFSPLNGYDVYKVDIWQAGVTLAQFFLPLKKVSLTAKPRGLRGQVYEEENQADDRQDWEKALWADDAGLSWSKLEVVWNNDRGERQAEEDNDEEEEEETLTGWKRETLFDASRGDLGLANTIFELLGLPQSSKEWSEADYFQPSLSRMPFARRPPAPGGLHQRLSSNHFPSSLVSIIDVLNQCINLSSSLRIDANEALQQLEQASVH
jgi:serine/threonine protein kinase